MTRTLCTMAILMLAAGKASNAAPMGAFSGSFDYTFAAFCADPPGAIIIFGITPCVAVDIDYLAIGSTSLFSNASLEMQTFLSPALPGPFPFTGTFALTDLANPANSIFGTIAGAGRVIGPPGPPVGFPPFGISGIFETTGGTGSFVGAAGRSALSGIALFTFLNSEATFASGEGTMTFSTVPEPSSALLLLLALAPLMLVHRRIRRTAS